MIKTDIAYGVVALDSTAVLPADAAHEVIERIFPAGFPVGRNKPGFSK